MCKLNLILLTFVYNIGIDQYFIILVYLLKGITKFKLQVCFMAISSM